MRRIGDSKAEQITHLGEADAGTDLKKMLLDVLPDCVENKQNYARSRYIKIEIK